MKLSTILDLIDSAHLALPEFQRGYVWNRDQVRSLMLFLYRGHPPVGGLLVWATEAIGAPARGDGLMEESHGLMAMASSRGYSVFTQLDVFKTYVNREVLPGAVE